MLGDFRKTKNYYDVLKVRLDTSDADVRKAFTTLKQEYEADKHPKAKKLLALRLRLLNEAFAALRTKEGRNRYNRLLLSSKGKPKGLVLKADNDNKSAANDRNLLGRITSLIKPTLPRRDKNKGQDHGG
jgi:curved DNA-binding protein CbpA